VPGFLSDYQDVTTVYFDDDNKWWAKVRKHLRRGDFKAAQVALISPEMRFVDDDKGESKQDTRGRVDTGSYQNELVARALVEWNLTDEEGVLLPLAPDEMKRVSVDLLPEPVFEKILNAIEGAAKKKKDEGAEDTFPKNGSGRALPAGSPKTA
jgi:hypothetical protein